ncbi:hypothetical protein RDWZM_008125 [Blomia tropicalis]|uniref:Protein kinase domain-containing protein n=1 Tax=Blomia tropicalis TaxID=40697 RepID=A0A9Q0RIK6_BLOTA|nr:hypothetical protein RDWZM_008125 [Blomia tropicalis]
MDEKDIKGFLASKGYDVICKLAEGGFAEVRKAKLVSEKETTTNFLAIKIFDLNKVNKAWLQNCLKNEMYISKNLKHPNIVLTLEVMKTQHYGFIVMALADGSLSTEMYGENRREYSIKQAKIYFKGLISGLKYMHEQNVAHRDLKLENFLLLKKTPMISDFGFAACGSRQSRTTLTQMLRKTCCGTPGYMAPELFATKKLQEYDAKAVDIYAMGVSLFEMLNYSKPYPDINDEDTIEKIANKDLRYKVNLPNEIKDLIESMLQFYPCLRPNVEQISHNQWLDPNSFTQFLNLFLGN